MTQSDDTARSFVSEVATQYGRRLRRFLAARLRNTADAPDLVQEVYLRLLRVNEHERIRNPEAYLFTIASHLVNERTLRQVAEPIVVEINDAFAELHSVADEDLSDEVDRLQRLQQLGRAIDKLSPKAQAALLLHRRDGYTLEEIALQLGVSRAMVKKYLANALAYCQRRLGRDQEGAPLPPDQGRVRRR